MDGGDLVVWSFILFLFAFFAIVVFRATVADVAFVAVFDVNDAGDKLAVG